MQVNSSRLLIILKWLNAYLDTIAQFIFYFLNLRLEEFFEGVGQLFFTLMSGQYSIELGSHKSVCKAIQLLLILAQLHNFVGIITPLTAGIASLDTWIQ